MNVQIRTSAILALCMTPILCCVHSTEAQQLDTLPVGQPGRNVVPTPDALNKQSELIDQVVKPELMMEIDPTRSQLMRTKLPMSRISITDPEVLEATQYGPYELELMGLKSGETSLTIWFTDPNANDQTKVLRYLVRVIPDRGPEDRADLEFGQLQRRLNEMFPNSKIQLVPVADKLIVRGQARDAQEASQIMSVLRGQAIDQAGDLQATAVNPISTQTILNIPGADDLPTKNIINLLTVPGEQQVMLKVRIAELTRTALRELGFDFEVIGDNFELANMFNVSPNFTAILDDGDVSLFIKAFSSNGYGKILAEPTLVTLSGHTARFIAGGEFAVPTAVGVDGIAAASTRFRGFGTQLLFTPTVLDKDRIRMHVLPSFSSVNSDLAVDGIPGLNTRAVATTVDLREGQWLAIAGLIQDQQGGDRIRIPGLGDIPIVGAAFGDQSTRREETELVVLVSPELVHPMEGEQVPLMLPGMGVTDPRGVAFFLHQRIEGEPWCDHRSTVWPAYRHLLHDAKKSAIKEARAMSKGHVTCQESHDYYLNGPVGFSN